MKSVPNTIYIDARALQDPDYRFRGVGQHSSALLRALRQYDWEKRRPLLVAALDPSREDLHPTHRMLFDRVIHAPRIASGEAPNPWFLSLSPMTHDPVWAAEFLLNDAVYRTALFYDLIPLEIPHRYLALPSLRSEYMVALAWLRCYDRFAAISQFTADVLVRRISIPPHKVFVSGVAVRRTLEPTLSSTPLRFDERDGIVVAGGGDPRKNPECAIVAHARSTILRRKGGPLRIFGSYPLSMREQFRALYAKHSDRPQDLVFLDHLSDDALHQLYRRSKVTVVASRAEGFSIPIIESNAANTPVVVSDVGAHPELIADQASRFDPDDVDHLQALLEDIVNNESQWQALQNAQAGLWRRYDEAAVGERLINGLLESAGHRSAAPAFIRKAKPDLAVLSPLPPAHSGVADYTAATLRPLTQVANLHMFTPTVGARWEAGWSTLGSVSSLALSSKRFEATICVMGNSFHHKQVHEYLMNYGGACIAHDARQIDYYFHELGIPVALAIARREMGRDVDQAELTKWLLNQRELPTLFLSELVAAGKPLMVHSPTTAKEIERLYGTKPVLLPFAQYSESVLDRLSVEGRKAARERLSLGPRSVVLVTFGIVSDDKAPQEIIWALNLLRSWGVDAELVFCGMAPPGMHQMIGQLTTRLDIARHVRTFTQAIDGETYRDYLVAADVGIQLRTYFMGGLSGALNDCIAAALPSIANAHLAEAMKAPPFVRRVADGLSSLLIGEAVLEILASGQNIERPIDEGRSLAAERSPEAYCAELLKALDLPFEQASLAAA